jgi:hypothetical protein
VAGRDQLRRAHAAVAPEPGGTADANDLAHRTALTS